MCFIKQSNQQVLNEHPLIGCFFHEQRDTVLLITITLILYNKGIRRKKELFFNAYHKGENSMSKHIIKAIVNGKEVSIGIADVMDSPPHEITIQAIDEMSEGLTDVMVVGLQYYDFSMFSMLIEVVDEDTVAHHFMIDSWVIRDVLGEPIHALKVENPYIYFNEEARKYLEQFSSL